MSPSAASPDAAVPPHDDDAERAERDRRLTGLLAQAAAGSTTAFEAFYDATLGYARALARRMLHGPDIDDLLAEVYFEVWRSAGRYDPARGAPVTWLLMMVRSRGIDVLRRHSQQGSAEAPDDDSTPDDRPDPAEQLWRTQAGSRLDTALRTLNATERWVLGLAYFRDLTHQAIADTTGLPLGTVKSLILRSQAKLRTRLGA